MVKRGESTLLDKLKIIDNIKLLAKMKKILLSEVEKAGGVTTGYLARLAFDINKFRDGHAEGEKERQLPPTDVMEKIACKLGITIDSLINIDFSQVKDAEGSVILFLDNLRKLTNRNSIIWKGDDFGQLHNEKHPLMRTRKEKGFDFETGQETEELVDIPYYFSLFLDQACDIYGTVYRHTSRGKTLMILESRTGNEYEGYRYYVEFYAIENNKPVKIAYTEEPGEMDIETPMYKALWELYCAAKKSSEINPNGDDIIKLINDYMDAFNIKDDDKEGDDE